MNTPKALFITLILSLSLAAAIFWAGLSNNMDGLMLAPFCLAIFVFFSILPRPQAVYVPVSTDRK